MTVKDKDYEKKYGKPVNMAENPQFSEALDKGFAMAQKLSQATILEAISGQQGMRNIPAALTIGAAVATGSLMTVAQIVEKESKLSHENHDVLLFSAMLVANHTILTGLKGHGSVMFKFDPGVVLDTIEMFERATGRKPEDCILGPMITAAREAGDECRVKGHAHDKMGSAAKH